MAGFSGSSSSLSGVLPLMAPAWVVWIVSGVLLNSVVHYKAYLPKLITDIMEYGKLRKKTRGPIPFNLFNLPKRWFTHFYIWGAFWILSISIVYFRSCVLFHSNPVPILDDLVSLVTGGYVSRQCHSVLQQHADTAVVLGMLSVQVVRRLYECLFVSVFSNARIHLVHYVLGLFFYPAVALTALLHLDYSTPQPEDAQDPSPLGVASFLRWYHLLALCLFLWASYHQHICHKILASLRRGKGEGQAYLRPDGDWFELVSCPHFFAEILIYVSVLLCCVSTDGWSCLWLVLVYVVSTLSLSARQAHTWYLQKFEDYPTTRRAIIPWVW